jgi:hypothetical protein
MTTTDKQKNAAAFATKSATAGMNDAGFKELSGLMCWDAVIRCALKGNAIEKKVADAAKIFGDKPESYKAFIDPTKDTIVPDAKSMRAVPQGCFLGFFENAGGKLTMIHAMMSTGQGLAAGNKNDCIGVGNTVGWEICNLAGDHENKLKKTKEKLEWADAKKGFMGPNPKAKEKRLVQVFYRPIG